MDIPELKAFIAVSDLGSFSKAAASLHISQPAISRRIQSLEQSLQQKLFDRDGQRIHLTTAGSILKPKARDILALAAATAETIKSIGDHIQGPLNLAISHHVAEHYLAPILTQFKIAYPAVELRFNFVESDQGCEAIARGIYDLGFVTIPENIHSDKLNSLELIKENLAFAVQKDHTLAQIKTYPELYAALSSTLALLPPLKSFTGQKALQELALLSVIPTEIIECNAFASLKALVISGVGWGVLPERLMTSDLISLAPQSPIHRSLGLVYHKNREASPAAKAFMKECRRQLLMINPED